jgi:hypothetical protein
MLRVLTTAFVIVASLAAFSSAHAEGGCGWGWHRGPFGGCRANGSGPVYVAPRAGPAVVVVPGGVIYAPAAGACPYGYHLGPQGRRCWPN